MLRAIPNRLSALWTRFRQEPATDRREREVIGKGHSLLRLHEYQHRVIIEIFRISITGTLVFSFVLIGFSLYSLLDPYAPSWMAVLTALIAVSLCAALVRTVQEFRTYRSNYQEISAILQSKLVKQTVKGTVAKQRRRPGKPVAHLPQTAGAQRLGCKNLPPLQQVH